MSAGQDLQRIGIIPEEAKQEVARQFGETSR
jgi:hypothetical protein